MVNEPEVNWPAEKILQKLKCFETVLLGVPGTLDGGLVGDVKEVRKTCDDIRKEMKDDRIAAARSIEKHERRFHNGTSNGSTVITFKDLGKGQKAGVLLGIGMVIAGIILGLINYGCRP